MAVREGTRTRHRFLGKHEALVRREFNRFATLLTRMGLSNLEARKLYEAFRKLDTDNSGVISGEEFKIRTW